MRELLKFLDERFHEFVLVVRSAVGEGPFQVIPYALIRIQFRGIGREELQMQTRKPMTEVTQRLALVNPAVVQQGNDMASQVPQQCTQECAHLFLLDVLVVKETIQAEAAARGADRHTGNGGDLVVPVTVAENRGLAARRPRFANVRDQQESRFVDKDEMGAQPRGVFLSEATCGVSRL